LINNINKTKRKKKRGKKKYTQIESPGQVATPRKINRKSVQHNFDQQILHTFKNDTISSARISMDFEEKQSEKSFTLNQYPHNVKLQSSAKEEEKSS
jgi:hypothetical protein